jgi:hypothetical protein
MVWVWVVLSLFVLWTLGSSLMRHETTPRGFVGGDYRQRGVWRACFLARAVRPSARYFRAG